MRGTSIRARFSLSFGVAMSVAALAVALSLIKVSDTGGFVENGLARLTLAARLGRGLAALQLDEDRYLSSGGAPELGAFHRQADAAVRHIRALSDRVEQPRTREDLLHLLALVENYRRLVDSSAEMVSGKLDDPAQFQHLLERKKAVVAELDALGGKLYGDEIEHTGNYLRQSLERLLLVLGIALATMGLGFIVAWRTGRNIVHGIVAISDSIREIHQSSRLDRRIEQHSDDELGDLAAAFNALLETHESIVERMAALTRELGATSEAISQAGRSVPSEADRTPTAMVERLVGKLRGLAGDVSEVMKDIQKGEQAVLGILDNGRAMADQVVLASGAVVETGTSIDRLLGAIEEVAAKSASVGGAAESTATAMSQITTAIREAQANAAETAHISERVNADAISATAALRKTVDGMGKIDEESRRVTGVIGALVGQVERVGEVLAVIEEVAAHTHVLSINAAILAGSAGEAGRGFAVVAGYIKELAGRTRASTSEIGLVIRAIQEGAREALAASERSAEAVRYGMGLSAEAEGSLAAILASLDASQSITARLTGAIDEQTRGSAPVIAAMQSVADSVEIIARASHGQAAEVQHIRQSVEHMGEVSRQVQQQGREQQAAADGVATIFRAITTKMAAIDRTHAEQVKANTQFLDWVHEIGAIVERYRQAAATLTRTVTNLSASAGWIEQEIGRFHGPIRKTG
jgi:methyl-accepting chemotaxis protein